MRSTLLKAISRTAVLAGAGILLTASVFPAVAAAEDIYLQAQSFDKEVPGGGMVPMWGFAWCPDDTFTGCDLPSAPGPQINLLTTDTLAIHVSNTLPTPVSLVIPELAEDGGGAPTFVTDGQGRQRVQSFTHETAAGGTGDYTWSSLRPGTFLYESGTHPSIQVPMGLYGALVVGPAMGVTCTTGEPAYDDLDSCHDSEAVLLFSEIDPWQNDAVASAACVAGLCPDGTTICTTDADCYPSTVNYTPVYFLINGEPYDVDMPPAAVPAGDPGESVLLRFLNAGLRSHVPTIVGLELGLLAEDSNPYPGLTKQQNRALLAAGKTLDTLVVMPLANATYPLFDRMLDLSNDNSPNGGMLRYLEVGTGGTPPSPPPAPELHTYGVMEDTVYMGVAPGGVMGATVVSGPSYGMLTLNDDGSFTYTPYENFSGTDTFSYRDSTGTLHEVTLNVSFENDLPVAVDDGPYVNAIGPDITVSAPGVLGNDSDPDGDTLTAEVVGTPPAGLTLNPDGSFEYTGGVSTTFSYHACDGESCSDDPLATPPATVTLNINPVAGIALTVQEPGGTPVTEYRWLVQEDATFPIDPASPPPPSDTLATRFHKSSMPLVAQGCVGPSCPTDNVSIPSATFDQVALDPDKRYYVSVLPWDAGTGEGHSLGGAQILPDMTAATVIVNNQPIPTAQVSVYVFEDDFPTNGVPDPNEPGLGGWEISLEDAGGRYGMAGGIMSQDADGNPLKNWLPCAPPADAEGVILTCADGTALIKNLPPGKFGVFAVPPAELRATETWTQTSTIEGTKLQDTWVKAGEPPFLVEFGAPGYHAFIGFVSPEHTTVPPGGTGSNTITGNVTMIHAARAPSQTEFDSGSYDALAHTRAWIGVNGSAGTGPNIATVQAAPDGSFTIEGIPDGTHQLVIWDDYLDQIISYQTVILPDGGNVGNIAVPTWFGRHEHTVFLDSNQDGVRQEGEIGLQEQNVNLRFRDGTVEQSFPTDTTGFVPFDQVFPYGAWQVAEVDFARFKPTGVTVTVDGGGDVSGGPYPGLLSVQDGSPHTDTDNPPVLLEGFQSMPGMTSLFEWGKAPYEPGENGGIAGIVYYASTRGENDPRLTAGDPWEPGIANVKVRLYREVATEGGGTALALVEEVETDSWDDSLPTGCRGELNPADPFIMSTLEGDAMRCFDGIRNYEQVRPGALFDGGYAFTDIPPGEYVVEVVPPPGYELYKEEDVNVGFGDAFSIAAVSMLLPGGALLMIMPDLATVEAALAPEPGLAQPPCVGEIREVPPYLSLFPDQMEEAPFAGALRPLCDRKAVTLVDQSQAAADFHLFTSTPVAGQFYGLTSDDVAIETNQASPNFGDKWGPAFLPYSMRDFQGHEIYRGYTDGFGRYNGLVPSTFSANLPIPSGYSPGMYSVCLNDPGDGPVPDPLQNPNYGNFCYTLMYMPGTTTYLDTPLLPLAAFAAGFNPVDCAFADDTPVIAFANVQGSADAPWSDTGGSTLVLEAPGNVDVPNPAYEGPLATMAPYNQPTVTRNYGFGEQTPTSKVTLDGVELTIGSWSPGTVQAILPQGEGTCSANTTTPPGPGATCTVDDNCPPNMGNPNTQGRCVLSSLTGEIIVTRGNGVSSPVGITLTMSGETPIKVNPNGMEDYTTIQDAIDAAPTGALILVEPAVYDELVVMWKPVRLQGAGTGLTIINAVKSPPEKLDAWRAKVKSLIDDGLVDLLPGQPADFDLVGPGLFGTELGAGITVLAKNCTGSPECFDTTDSRIDGFTITGADGGGGIFVNGYAHNLVISNNRVTGNSGVRHGGIRIGHSFLPLEGPGPFGFNTNVTIHHNAITLNGGQADVGAGGGLSLCAGSDNYNVSRNFICGNFHLSDGGGIGHLGLSDGGLIESNQIVFNQTFNQGLGKSGGGLFIAGEPPVAGALTLGAGDVTANANLIQGNQAGSGHGGGVRTQSVNGTETPSWSLTFTNNMIVNNVAGWSGGGMSLQDTINASVINNTIANNDSTATVGDLVVGNTSTPQPAGISAERHSLALADALGEPEGFSDPTAFVNNVVWHNRSFTYDATAGASQLLPVLAATAIGECPAGASYWDLGVLGEPQAGPALQLNPTSSILTDTTGYDGSNLSGDPDFVNEYCNGARTLSTPGPMQVAAEVVEGGNFIEVRYGPLTQSWPVGSPPWNYHIGSESAGLDNADSTDAPDQDFDADARPEGAGWDRGADELVAAAPPPTGMCVGGTNAGGTCASNDDCPPQNGPPPGRGSCVF